MPQPRSPELQLVAYALARCGVPDAAGTSTLPPPWLGTAVWKTAYDQFYDALADGREALSFRNTLKNARDAFDAHVPNSRTGWVDHQDGGKPWRADSGVRAVLDVWTARPESELVTAVLAIRDGALPGIGEDERPEGASRTEGGRRLYVSWRSERDPANRRKALALHGCVCMACRFDFGAAYGPAGAGYAEVHHAMPLADYGVRKTDPAKDLVVLCANCHRMVHRKRGECLSLEALRALVDDGRRRTGLALLWAS
jgi:hypothetical protein